jgi:hypothetical protein
MKLSWHARGAVTAERMRHLMQLRGVTPNGHPLWEKPEETDLREGVPDYKAVRAKVTRRTTPACYSKASRLKITRPRGRPWSDNDILRLRIYRHGTREEVLATLPGRTWRAIAKQANARGIYRPKRPLKPTGNGVLDQILKRARERNVSMIELDQEAKRKGYYSSRRWQTGRFNHRAHGLAVEFLGGQLGIRWANERV